MWPGARDLQLSSLFALVPENSDLAFLNQYFSSEPENTENNLCDYFLNSPKDGK